MGGEQHTLIFRVDGVEHEIALDHSRCPRTLAKVIEALPARVDIHCAKIAGSHIMWPVPFIEGVEEASDVLDMPAGSFFFWPERQYLEITYAPLQAETAAVNYLGKLRGDVEWLRDYAERQRRGHGGEIFTADVYLKGGARPAEPDAAAYVETEIAAGSPALKQVRAARLDAWAGETADVRALLARRGLNIPFGPLVMAEGELRKAHELLWRLWNAGESLSDAQKCDIARFTIEAAITRVGGFCHMNDTAAILEKLIECFDGADPVADVLAEGVLFTGRVAAWLDLYIQWWPFNEVTLDTLGKTDSLRKAYQ
ncbi:hypothetical protein [Oricola thermophila]|uniref:DUF3830 family protein n=1 Tax=Oricola thermophila TaxID=2742145 RepID=A0A6N1VGH9_9HYPH|nr:hypothetical protein [Oricola thermophila]QKV20030.1 hypothetical protein HTY61_17025 [Oricola thermophila]